MPPMTDWKRIVLPVTATIGDAIHVLDSAPLKTCLIVGPDGALAGTVTDGDIRRGLLRSLGVRDPVEAVMNRAPHALKRGARRDAALRLMATHHINLIPVVDDSGKVVDLEISEEDAREPETHDNWVVLMAGGLGTRLHPMTETMPKPMLPVGDKPLLETTLECFINQGFSRFFIAVNYKSQVIQDHFGDGGKWNVDIRYLEEEKRLGTAGALRLLPARPKAPLIVMNGDVLTRLNFGELLAYHRHQKAQATMSVRAHSYRVPFGVVEIDGHSIKNIDEKPVSSWFVNAGIYVLDSELVDLIPEDEFFDMTTLFERIIEIGHATAVFPIREYWLDVGSTDTFHLANDQFPGEFK